MKFSWFLAVILMAISFPTSAKEGPYSEFRVEKTKTLKEQDLAIIIFSGEVKLEADGLQKLFAGGSFLNWLTFWRDGFHLENDIPKISAAAFEAINKDAIPRVGIDSIMISEEKILAIRPGTYALHKFYLTIGSNMEPNIFQTDHVWSESAQPLTPSFTVAAGDIIYLGHLDLKFPVSKKYLRTDPEMSPLKISFQDRLELRNKQIVKMLQKKIGQVDGIQVQKKLLHFESDVWPPGQITKTVRPR
jgi:hypothetical protein